MFFTNTMALYTLIQILRIIMRFPSESHQKAVVLFQEALNVNMKQEIILKLENDLEQIRTFLQLPRQYTQPITLMIIEQQSDLPDVISYDFLNETHIIVNSTSYKTSDNVPLHSHDYFEFMYFYREDMNMHIEDQVYHYSQGDMLLMNRNIRHAEVAREGWAAIYLCLENLFFRDYPKDFGYLFSRGSQLESFIMKNLDDTVINKKDYIHFAPKRPDDAGRLEELLLQIRDEMKLHNRSMKFRVYACIVEIFQLLESGRAFQMNYTNLGNFPDTRKAEKIKRLIEKHHGLISREEIANILNYSPNYVYHIFQKVMKRSVQDYCQEVQVRTFASKLENTELSIDQICKECGQKNKTQFYKIFKRFYHMPPKEYREYIKNAGSETPPTTGRI